MINPYKKNAKLVLSNGIVFPGFFFGASGTAIGEIVFNTGMTGYQEVITDPSYYGQILTFTYPEIGNTGINFEDSESNINVKGIIVRNYSSNNSNWRSNKNFDKFNPSILGVSSIILKQLSSDLSREVITPFMAPLDLKILTSALVSIPYRPMILFSTNHWSRFFLDLQLLILDEKFLTIIPLTLILDSESSKLIPVFPISG